MARSYFDAEIAHGRNIEEIRSDLVSLERTVMQMQMQMEHIIGTAAPASAQAPEPELSLAPGQIGVVAVAAGDGLAQIFRSLGAAGIVDGGQSLLVDTLFDLPEGCLYSVLVSLKDEDPALIPASYRVLFNDIREAVDTIHRDGTLKRRIIADLDRFFLRDPDLGPTLHAFREAGKRLFLLTNSEADYTAAVMDHAEFRATTPSNDGGRP